MQLRRFTSDSTSKALQAVREAFGDEAVILSNRQVDGKVEIIATGTFDENALMASAGASEIVTAVPATSVPVGATGSAAANDAASTSAAEPTSASAPAAPDSAAATVSAFVPEAVPAPPSANRTGSLSEGDDEVTVSLSGTARAAASDIGGREDASDTFSSSTAENGHGSPSSEPTAASTPEAGTAAAADMNTSGEGAASAAAPAPEPVSAIDSLSRDLEAMSDDERPLSLGPVPELDARAIEREAREERGRGAGEGTGSAGPRTDAVPSSPPVHAAAAAGEDENVGPSTAAAIGQVLAVAERRHAERSRRLEQRLLRLEVNLWGELEPLRSAHLRQLVRLGVGMELAVRLVERITVDMSAKTAMRQSLALLKATLPVGVEGTGRAPGVTVLSGPAGGGKTTTLVKLATRQVRLHGAQSTVLVAADARRIGAFESLQAYGRLLGVPVVQARGAEELADHIDAFAHKPLVLVDHVPLEMADALPLPAADSLGECDGVRRELRRLLVLPATMESSAFEAQVALHRRHRISHVVLTQIDRATRLASCFAPLIRHALPIAHVSDDSRVLTPLDAADAATLVATAMTRGQEKASDKDEELLLNLLQPTRRVIESVAAADEAPAGRADTSDERTASGSRASDAAAAESTRDTAANGTEHRPESVSGPGAADSAPPADAAADGAIVRRGTLERIVAFEVVDHDSVIENGGLPDAVETREVVESLGDMPSSPLDDTSFETESAGRRARAARRALRGANERTNRQETRR